jgi:hypothetical protein
VKPQFEGMDEGVFSFWQATPWELVSRRQITNRRMRGLSRACLSFVIWPEGRREAGTQAPGGCPLRWMKRRRLRRSGNIRENDNYLRKPVSPRMKRARRRNLQSGLGNSECAGSLTSRQKGKRPDQSLLTSSPATTWRLPAAQCRSSAGIRPSDHSDHSRGPLRKRQSSPAC